MFLQLNAVLFDAPQIPAGMHSFRRIPQESTGCQWNGTGFHRNLPQYNDCSPVSYPSNCIEKRHL